VKVMPQLALMVKVTLQLALVVKVMPHLTLMVKVTLQLTLVAKVKVTLQLVPVHSICPILRRMSWTKNQVDESHSNQSLPCAQGSDTAHVRIPHGSRLAANVRGRTTNRPRASGRPC